MDAEIAPLSQRKGFRGERGKQKVSHDLRCTVKPALFLQLVFLSCLGAKGGESFHMLKEESYPTHALGPLIR